MTSCPAHGRLCKTCYTPIARQYIAFGRRVEVVDSAIATETSAASIKVLCDETLVEFCSSACWDIRKADIVRAFELKEFFPRFQMKATCAVCGSVVDRTSLYLTLNWSELIETEKPWLASAQVLEDREFAILCSRCDPADHRPDEVKALTEIEATEGLELEELLDQARSKNKDRQI